MARANFTDEQAYEQKEILGAYYSNINLDDLINNFIFAYTGKGKVLTNVSRAEVVFWAQRSVQEFAYDITRSEQVEELEVNRNTLTASLPADFVSLNKITLSLSNGEEVQVKRIYDRSFSIKNQLYDDEGEPLFDDDGEIITTETSETVHQWQKPINVYTRQLVEDLYWSDYYFNSDYEYGRRYGLNPERANLNPQFYLSTENATIYFNDRLNHIEGQGEQIVKMYYITDGLKNSSDLSTVLIPKFAEDAVYEDMLHNLCRLRPDTAAVAPVYQKSAMAKKRTAKLRIQGWNNLDWQQIVKQKSKWIKY